jgi:hypothetical protein
MTGAGLPEHELSVSGGGGGIAPNSLTGGGAGVVGGGIVKVELDPSLHRTVHSVSKEWTGAPPILSILRNERHKRYLKESREGFAYCNHCDHEYNDADAITIEDEKSCPNCKQPEFKTYYHKESE